MARSRRPQNNTSDSNDSLISRITTLETPTYIDAAFATTATVSADTYVDVTSSSLNLTPGKWEIILQAPVTMINNSAGALNFWANIGIFDASNNVVDSTLAALDKNNMAAGESLSFHISLIARATVTTTTTYKLRIRAGVASASGVFTVLGDGSSLTGSLTNPDMGAKFYAKKVG
jgi:hypothetical protein